MASSLEGNKLAAAVLTAGIIAMGSGVISRILYSPHQLDQPVFVVQLPDTEVAPVAAEPDQPLPVLLATGSVESGERAFRRCVACHTPTEGGAHGVGPNLWDKVNHPIGAREGYAYSATLAGMDGVWDYEALDGFLKAPREWAPGTKMSFAGIASAQERADIILYLRSLSNDPAPLPEAEEAAPAAAAAAADAAAPLAGPTVGADQVETVEPPTETAATEPDTGPEAEPQLGVGTGLPPAEPPEPPAADTAETAPAEPAPAEAPPTETAAVASGTLALIADADPAAGERAARVCAACHTFNEGGPHRVGPNLWDVVGGPFAHAEGFNYSAAIRDHGGEWTYEALDAYLKNPREFIPGNRMAFAGVRNDEDRAAIIAYLRTLSNDPKPLPGQGG
jgi:cytochrome c